MNDYNSVLLPLFVLFFVLNAAATIAFLVFRSRYTKASQAVGRLTEQVKRMEARSSIQQTEFDHYRTNTTKKLARFDGIVNIETEMERLSKQVQETRAAQAKELAEFDTALQARKKEAIAAENQIILLKDDLEKVNEKLDLQSFGYYTNRYDFDVPEAYQTQLEGVRCELKRMLQSKIAAHSDATWSINGSAAEGRKQIDQVLKLMLRAFNGEADAAIAKVKYSNVHIMEERIRRVFEAANKLGSYQLAYISSDYLQLKLEELYLVHEYREKLQQAKEEQREIRVRMRDEEIARREIAKALEDAEKDEVKYSAALEEAIRDAETAAGARQEKLVTQIANLERRLAEVLLTKERALSRAQLTRSGHVYVVSNIGSFGENVYKIGMTRRLDPQDRVLELGDASVPFRFDVHAIIYFDDAPALEFQLHKKFHERRINKVNYRKEFFRVTLDEIAAAVHEMHGEIEFTAASEAEEYRKTIAHLGGAETKLEQPLELPNSFEDDEILEVG
jgi:hypothetical protein